MKPTEKYLHIMRAVRIRDVEELSDAGLDAMLGAAGPAADPAKRNPHPLTATGLVELLGAIVTRSDRQLEAAAEVFGLDLERMQRTAEAEAEAGGDPVTANETALERELARRGETARPLTRWILENAERLCGFLARNGREQVAAEVITHFEGRDKYAGMLRDYFNWELEIDNTECRLNACCVLFGLDRESVTERAAILEYDAGMDRTAAAIRAVWLALQAERPGISELEALTAFDYEDSARGWSRGNLEWMSALLQSAPKPNANSIPRPPRKAAS